MTTIDSIGHSRHAAEHFVGILRAQEIALLVDVRSHPASKYDPVASPRQGARMLASRTSCRSASCPLLEGPSIQHRRRSFVQLPRTGP